jgi:hypothetical protein
MYIDACCCEYAKRMHTSGEAFYHAIELDVPSFVHAYIHEHMRLV